MTTCDFKLFEISKLGWGWSVRTDELHVISRFYDKKEDAQDNMQKYQNTFLTLFQDSKQQDFYLGYEPKLKRDLKNKKM